MFAAQCNFAENPLYLFPATMGKQCDWMKVSRFRTIVKDMKTPVQKSRNGNTVGGTVLNAETVKPYLKQLELLEAKIAKDKEAMSTKDRVDDAAQEVMADAAQNNKKIIEALDDRFAKLAPKKFAKIKKWAYVSPASGSAGEAAPKIKVRVDEYMDKELDLYKYYDSAGNVGCAPGSALDWIIRVGQTVQLKENLPKHLGPQNSGTQGIVATEPPASKPESPSDMFEVSMSDGKTRKVRREFLIFDDDVDEGDADDWDDSFISVSLISAAASQEAGEVVPPADDESITLASGQNNLEEEKKEQPPREEKTPREKTKSGEVVQPAGDEEKKKEENTPREAKKEKTPREAKKEKTPREKTNSDDPVTTTASVSQKFGKPVIKWIHSVCAAEEAMAKDVVEHVRQFFDKPKMVNEIARELRSLNKDCEKYSKPFVATWDAPPQPMIVIACRHFGTRFCAAKLSRTE